MSWAEGMGYVAGFALVSILADYLLGKRFGRIDEILRRRKAKKKWQKHLAQQEKLK